ncbi:hypothetical protein GCM10010286_21990 [Streptomyces toxytricini]|nr:hypothetical protein GCM10010286_21990 [Streptomyces toxytricini]
MRRQLALSATDFAVRAASSSRLGGARTRPDRPEGGVRGPRAHGGTCGRPAAGPQEHTEGPGMIARSGDSATAAAHPPDPVTPVRRAPALAAPVRRGGTGPGSACGAVEGRGGAVATGARRG